MATVKGWYRPKLTAEKITIRSTLYDLPLHWVEELRFHARCPRIGCQLCEHQWKLKQHSAAVVQWEGGGALQLLELTEQHARVINDLDCLQTMIFGQQLIATRVVRDRSVDLDISLSTRIEAPEIIAHNYVKTIGVAQYLRTINTLRLDRERQPEVYLFDAESG